MSGRRLIGDQQASMATLFAVAFSLATILSAIVVDASALYLERRHLQAGVDLAAIAAAGDPSRARPLAETALINAGLGEALVKGELRVVVGHYSANPALDPHLRFTPGAAPLNAAMVEMRYPGSFYFATGVLAPPSLAARGLARVVPEVAFTLGSRLASLDGGIANALLSRLLGTSVSLSVMDYSRLANARVDVLEFLDALAFEMNLEAVTYDDLLRSEARTGAIAAALSGIVNGAEKSLLRTISLAGPGHKVPLGKLFDLGRLGRLQLLQRPAALATDLSVLEILSAAAALADGTRQVHVSLGGAVPGIAAFEVDLALGEPPQGGGWFALGPNGTMVRTAQLRLRLAVRVLAGSVVSGGVLNLPIWLDIAPAQAQLLSASCPGATEPLGSARIALQPGVATIAIGTLSNGEMTNFGTVPPVVPAKLLDAILVSITGSARVSIAQTAPVVLDFSSTDISLGTLKTARTQTFLASLTASLLDTLQLKVTIDLLNILAIGLNVDVVARAVVALLAPLAAPIDTVLSALLQTLGVGVGEGDVRVYAVRCTNVALVG